MHEDPAARPVRLIVTDDLVRSRVTVIFRLLLVIPAWITLWFWTVGAFFVVIGAWFVTLLKGRCSSGMHEFLAAYTRYAAQVSAYMHLTANPFPGFGPKADYPVRVEIDGPETQRRWSVFFRIFLALPALLLTAAVGGSSGFGVPRKAGVFGVGFSGIGAGGIVSILGWFAAVARGRMPRGLRDLGTYGIGYSAQSTAYLLLLTDRYPSTDPRLAGPQELPPHPIRVEVNDDLSRSRLLVLFRGLLVLPHLVWLLLWTILAILASFAGWLIAPFIARLPRPLHRFLAAYVRYAAHVSAFIGLIGGPFPGFVGKEGTYPIDIVIDSPERQGRAGLVFRGILVIPAILIASAYGGLANMVAILGWFYALFRGRMPVGMRDIGAAAIRYQAQAWGYAFLLTDRYAHAAPTLEGLPPEPEQLTLDWTLDPSPAPAT
jgi:hypothetical protein